ncbi:class I SAM-dependent DNA methyltransferase [Streptomyces sp. NPDC058471]|uniref:class I SAM-dependent DNA methyltransferase n=1 Tax=Streptomyces sp. NPDC058471 TaxID=3346516 RepID=UPI0036551B2C
MRENATEVTAAGIARLAGVGRAAVSNWRRRHPDFPKPVGGTETSPSFALTQVEEWLRTQGKLGKLGEVPLKERVWQHLAGHPAGPVTALLHAGCALLLVRDRHPDWLKASAVSDERMAKLLPDALAQVVTPRFGPPKAVGTGPRQAAVRIPDADRLLPSVPLLRGVAELASELGARQTYEFLIGRHIDANPRQYTLTPAGPADLMAALAGPAPTVLDPACGTGALLRAVAPRPDQHLYGQDSAPELAALTALRLALHSDATVRAAAADTLRADAFGEVRADAVLCHPPFNERNWGHDELAYDPRWEYGFPARTESELAWVQHALARLRDGGTAVLLMPPAAASRRSGRRVRADLLRRGALRAVIALPAGAAPPYNIPLHVWVLKKPAPGAQPPPELLLVETAGLSAADGRDRHAWRPVRDAVVDVWRTFDRHGTAAEQPGLARCVPVLELLDDEVDLAPARRLPPPAAGGGVRELTDIRERLGEAVRRTADLMPAPAEAVGAVEAARRPATTVGELARAGALSLRTGTGIGAPGTPVLTEHDLLSGAAPSGSADPLEASATDGSAEPVLTEPGDIVIPLTGGGTAARVIDEATAGAALGRGLTLLRPDPAALDPWFLAGFLRGTANHRQASSYASTAARLDVRRLRLPRLPLDGQRGYGERFRALAAFEDALRLAGRLGEQLVRGLHDGLTDGTLPPE